MSTTTSNLGLKKPDTTDFYDIADFNGNADILDTFAGETITTDKLVNNLASTAEGFGLDSRQGKAIGDRLNTAEDTISEHTTQLSENVQNLNTHKADLITDLDGVHGLKIESGTFTPVITGTTTSGANTYTAQRGRYNKIGKQVTVFIDVALSTKDIAMAGAVTITGLPYVPTNDTNYRFSSAIGFYYGFNFPTSCYNLMGTLVGGSSQISIVAGNSTSIINLDTTNILNNFRITLELTYLIV